MSAVLPSSMQATAGGVNRSGFSVSPLASPTSSWSPPSAFALSTIVALIALLLSAVMYLSVAVPDSMIMETGTRAWPKVDTAS